jgi:alginate O-acetyltransferase complex protein AlgI
MAFDSLEFVAFIALFFGLWPLVRAHNTPRWLFMAATSILFYAWGSYQYVWVLLTTGYIDYRAALAMEKYPKHKKRLLWVSLAANLGMLGVFKYLDFFIGNLNSVTALAGLEPLPMLKLELPIGISFYTFESMSYTIDVYRGRFKATNNVIKFYAFLSLWPRLAAGPIVRAGQFIPQLDQYNPVTPMKWWNGTRLIVYGFFKKLVIADQVAGAVDTAFRAATINQSAAYWWYVMLLFSVQIYGDFSGYSDIARGLGKWMGVEFPINFRHPFVSFSVTKVWTRWHISLVNWFRDYLYYPIIGRNYRSKVRGNIAMTTVLVCSGFWHGAMWSFIVWGLWHSLFTWIERDTQYPERLLKIRGGRHVAMLITFALFMLSNVFFRIGPDVGRAFLIVGRMLTFTFGDVVNVVKEHQYETLAAAFVLGRHAWFYFEIPKAVTAWRRRVRFYTEPLELGILLAAVVFLRGPGHQFIYFQF